MENKTAIDWLEDNLIFESWAEEHFKHNKECWDKAKQMEKQQIFDAYSIGAINGEMIERDIKPKYSNPIEYYNETFKSE